jgi:hypothetical protein
VVLLTTLQCTYLSLPPSTYPTPPRGAVESGGARVRLAAGEQRRPASRIVHHHVAAAAAAAAAAAIREVDHGCLAGEGVREPSLLPEVREDLVVQLRAGMREPDLVIDRGVSGLDCDTIW